MKKIKLILIFINISFPLKAIDKTELICECISERTHPFTSYNFYNKYHDFDLSFLYEKGCLSEKIILDSIKNNGQYDILYASRGYLYTKISATVIKAEIKYSEEYRKEESTLTFDSYTGKLIEDYTLDELKHPNDVLGGYIGHTKIFDCKKRDKIF